MKKSELIEKLQKSIERLDAIDFKNLDAIGKIILVTRKDSISAIVKDVKLLNTV